MNEEQKRLWARLENYTPDESGTAYPFTKRLARDNAWTMAYAERVVTEYKRFAFLAMVAGHPVTPSDQVDQAWHLHMLYTRSYWEDFCGNVLGNPLHHQPTKGGSQERDKFHDWYDRTKESYFEFFGEHPPSDIWPDSEKRFGEDVHYIRVNTKRNWVLPKPAFFEWDCREAKHLLSRSYLIPILAVLLIFLMVCSSGCSHSIGQKTLHAFPVLDAGLFFQFWLSSSAVAIGLRFILKYLGRVMPSEVESSKINPYELAYLSGEKERCITVALANLAHKGVLEIDKSEKKMKLAGELPDNVHDFERKLFNSINRGESVDTETVRERNENDLDSIKSGLFSKGMLLSDSTRKSVTLIPWIVSMIAPVIAFAGVVFGSFQGNASEMFLCAIVGLVVSSIVFLRMPWRSFRGDRKLSEIKLKNTRLYSAPYSKTSEGAEGLALSVGLFGPVVLRDTSLSEVISVCPDGDSCGGGDGGGDGDGGCGGCGGCGCG